MEKLFLFFLKDYNSPFPSASVSSIENKGTAISEHRTAILHTRISKLSCSMIVWIWYQCSAHHRKGEKNQYTTTITKFCIMRIKSFSYLNYLSTCSFRQDINRLCIFYFSPKNPQTPGHKESSSQRNNHKWCS